MKKFSNQKNKKTRTGFALLFAVLLASFLITLGISIFSISLKEIQISTSARDSQVAYYVADSARECAIYWASQGAFPPCFNNDSSLTSCLNTSPTVTCNGVPVVLNFLASSTAPQYSSYSTSTQNFFQASSTSSSTPVADISIDRTFANGRVNTTIITEGHNTGIPGRRVERGIKQTYP